MTSRTSIARSALIVLPLIMFPGAARAFTIESPITDGCHEQVSEAALRNVRTAFATAPPIAANENEQALIDDVEFTVPSDMNDLASTSFLIGVRDNDLKGRSPTDLSQLATVHGDPNLQEEHCLRDEGDDEPTGTSVAIPRCTTFIHDRAMLAVAALDANGVPDPNVRENLDVSLTIRGRVTASLPAFWVRIGQAIHAIEDSFAHTYRTADGMEITVDLDWIDLANEQENPVVDGPPHKSDLDKCNAGDALRTRNKALATQAATALLTAVLDPSLTSAEKSDHVNAVLAEYLTISPGCTSQNNWCNAPENAYVNASACGCALVGGDGSAPSTAFLAVFGGAFAIAIVRRRRARRLAASAVSILSVLFVASSARADTNDSDAPVQPRTQGETTQAVKEQVHASPFALSANVGGSFVDAGLAETLGVRFRLSDHFVIGLDGELNEWYGVNHSRFDLGATSVYATGIFRFPMRYEPINLRATVHVGGSYEMLDLYGVPKGSVGLFAGLFPLGIEWKLSGHVFLIVNPLGVAIPIPHLTGVPFAYPQFRTELGIEVSL